MKINVLQETINFLIELIQLSDAAFHNLFGLLLVLVFSRLLLPLHRLMAKELMNKNEIVDLAEKDNCTEFDIFVMALEHYDGQHDKNKAERDFSHYLRNWPENYVLPYYIRLYLKMRNNGISNSHEATNPAG